MTNILITGVTGFIGSHLAEHLSNNKKNIILVNGNVNNSVTIERCLYQYEIDQIYHLAAQAIVKDAAQCPVSTIETNAFGTLNILENVRKFREIKDKEIPTFVMSTDKAYGISDNLPYTEDFPLNGLDIYSASKACEDIIARSYAYNYDLPITVGRPANTYGLDFNWTRLIPSLSKSCLSTNNSCDTHLILNEGSYHYIREYNYVEDTVCAIESLIKNIDKTKGQAYNIGSGFKYTTEDLVKTFLSLIPESCYKKIEFKKKESTFKEIPEQYLDSSKIRKNTCWMRNYCLEDGLRKTIKNYQKWFSNEMSNNCSTSNTDIEMCNQKLC